MAPDLSLTACSESTAALRETSSSALGFPDVLDLVSGFAISPLGRARVASLLPSRDHAWISRQQAMVAEIGLLLESGSPLRFNGMFDPTDLLEQTRIQGAALEAEDILRLLVVIDNLAAWRDLVLHPPTALEDHWPEVLRLSAPLMETDFAARSAPLRDKFEPDGSLSNHASPALARIRREIERQQRAIEDDLRSTLRKLAEGGALQEELITLRGERFVIPVKAEMKRRVPGVVHGASSSGQTVYVEPLETIEQNNVLIALFEEEQEEIRRILAAMTRAIGELAPAIQEGVAILAEIESLVARARFAREYACVRPALSEGSDATISVTNARHPLLERRLRREGGRVVPLTLHLGRARQLIISGPNTGGKTVALKTIGLLALMAQAGIPVPAEQAAFPVFHSVLADIGDAQSIEQNLSTFSAHITQINYISGVADDRSLVLLDELGSATDPEEGAALATAVAAHFLSIDAWSIISTHHTALKIYAANTPGVLNAAAGFDEQTLAPTYELRVGVPGASAGLNMARRIGLAPDIVDAARARLGTQTADISRFIDRLHRELRDTEAERQALRAKEQEVARERNRLDYEGVKEQRAKVRELEQKLESVLKDFDYRSKEIVRSIEDRATQQKVAKVAERRAAQMRREFAEEFKSAALAHRTGSDKQDPHAQPHIVRNVSVGDTVKLRSLGKNAVVQRQLDDNQFEVAVGIMKMRVPRDDIAQVVSNRQDASPLQSARSRGIHVSVAAEDAPTMELNVIGRTVDEASDELEKFLDRAFLAGVPRIRIVHGTGTGALRRALRENLRRHPQVALVAEAAQNEGGGGATIVDLKL